LNIEPHWLWIGAGLVLAALEMLVPGVYLIWLALAAIATGVLVLAGEPSVPMQIVSFVSLSLIFAFSAKRWLRDKPIESSDPLMNQRAARLVGQTATVTQAGTRVRIAGVSGACLTVEALELPGPAQ
jgi:inner membrane protein